MSLQYRVSEGDLKEINGHLLDIYNILEGILLNPMVQPDSNGASSVGNASHASLAFGEELQPDKRNVFTHATLKKVGDEGLHLLAGHSGNIIGYLVCSDPNPANKNLWHLALRCEICHEEEWKIWPYSKSRQDAIFPWHVTKNYNGGYVYCQKCRPAPSSYLCAC